VTTVAQSQSKLLSFATFEEFLDWERHQETKHELVDGEPVAMAGGRGPQHYPGQPVRRSTC
jgi:Uma2 family endonuclease